MTNGSNPYAPPPPPGGRPTNPSYNPYAPPSAQVGMAGGTVDGAEAIRRQNLNHEASLRSFGCLYYWTGWLFLLFAVGGAGLFVVSLFQSDNATGEGAGFWLILTAVYFLLGWLYLWLGKGLRALEPKVRLLLTVFAVLGLLGFPLITIISLYFLYLLHGEKGRRIMTPEYQRVVAQTPHIKYKTPLWVWLVVGLAVLAILGGLVVAAMGV